MPSSSVLAIGNAEVRPSCTGEHSVSMGLSMRRSPESEGPLRLLGLRERRDLSPALSSAPATGRRLHFPPELRLRRDAATRTPPSCACESDAATGSALRVRLRREAATGTVPLAAPSTGMAPPALRLGCGSDDPPGTLPFELEVIGTYAGSEEARGPRDGARAGCPQCGVSGLAASTGASSGSRVSS